MAKCSEKRNLSILKIVLLMKRVNIFVEIKHISIIFYFHSFSVADRRDCRPAGATGCDLWLAVHLGLWQEGVSGAGLPPADPSALDVFPSALLHKYCTKPRCGIGNTIVGGD